MINLSSSAFSQDAVTGEIELFYSAPFGDQPYSIYVPSYYSETKSFPMVIVLHGAGDDHKKFFHGNGYRDGLIKKVAEEYGMIVVCPKGNSDTGWSGPGETDFLKVKKEVEKKYNIDPQKRFLLGHSMGGGGALIFSAKYRGEFAAVAVCAPSRAEPSWAPFLKGVPVYLVHGTKDKIIPLENSQIFVAALEREGCEVEFKMIKGADHNNYVADQFTSIFAFFEENPLN